MATPETTPGTVRIVSHDRSPLTNGTWVLVADGEKALLLENVGDAEYPLLEVRREDHQDNPPTRDQGTDRPGRYSDGPQAQRSAISETDWHRLAEDRFAADLADMILSRVRKARIDRLIVAVGPRMLGDLRNHLHGEVKDRIVGEVPLTLTNHPVDEMARHIADHLVEDASPPEE